MSPEVIRAEIDVIVLIAFRASGAIVQARERLGKPTCTEASIDFLMGRIEDKKEAIIDMADTLEAMLRLVRQY